MDGYNNRRGLPSTHTPQMHHLDDVRFSHPFGFMELGTFYLSNITGVARAMQSHILYRVAFEAACAVLRKTNPTGIFWLVTRSVWVENVMRIPIVFWRRYLYPSKKKVTSCKSTPQHYINFHAQLTTVFIVR